MPSGEREKEKDTCIPSENVVFFPLLSFLLSYGKFLDNFLATTRRQRSCRGGVEGGRGGRGCWKNQPSVMFALEERRAKEGGGGGGFHKMVWKACTILRRIKGGVASLHALQVCIHGGLVEGGVGNEG